MVRELQRSILEAAGYRVVTAKHGREALEQLAAHSEIDLVVTDVDMPEMDGLDADRGDPGEHATGRRSRSSSSPRAHSDEDRRRGVEAGADAYMVKDSFDQHALLETVARMVGE